MLDHPSLAELLPSGVFMVNDDYNNRMVAIDPATGALACPAPYRASSTPLTASTCCCRTDQRPPTRQPGRSGLPVRLAVKQRKSLARQAGHLTCQGSAVTGRMQNPG
jgi:hypothetical protein